MVSGAGGGCTGGTGIGGGGSSLGTGCSGSFGSGGGLPGGCGVPGGVDTCCPRLSLSVRVFFERCSTAFEFFDHPVDFAEHPLIDDAARKSAQMVGFGSKFPEFFCCIGHQARTPTSRHPGVAAPPLVGRCFPFGQGTPSRRQLKQHRAIAIADYLFRKTLAGRSPFQTVFAPGAPACVFSGAQAVASALAVFLDRRGRDA
jgi:hypothetical protein